MIWIVVAILAVLALREFVFVPFKQNPYEYETDKDKNEKVKDNTDK